LEFPLFPGYIFCHFDLANRLPLLTIPGVKEIVGMGKLPYPVDENEITVLQNVVESGLLLRPWPFLKVGQRVMIREGPLRNGILAEIRGDYKLVVSITLLQRSVAVGVDRAWVHPFVP
jgi:transcription antitermination factor NusG